MNCPLCSSNSKEIFAAKGFPVRDCGACGHRFAEVSAGGNHVSEIYDDSYFNGGGAGYSDYLAEGEMLRRRGRDYAKILARHAAATEEKGKILDVGAAAGFVLQGFCDAGWRGAGIEPNASMARAGREKFALEIFQGDFENFESGDEKFDAVSMIQVAAHFHNPRRAFQNAFDSLKPGGILLVETWNYKSLTARVFGRNWHEYSPPSVLHWFSPETLSGFLRREIGFEKLAQGRPAKKISGEHAKSLLRYRLGNKFDSFLKLIPGKINFPYPAEDLFWALYRKQK
ncbi:MAG TPA: class I SAM-dependent methyltransferase [Pyrinomonadaceae bacterium]|nr:class I SAM-dependent methyltransferase [Pyrinomonadaceae bacterium]